MQSGTPKLREIEMGDQYTQSAGPAVRRDRQFLARHCKTELMPCCSAWNHLPAGQQS